MPSSLYASDGIYVVMVCMKENNRSLRKDNVFCEGCAKRSIPHKKLWRKWKVVIYCTMYCITMYCIVLLAIEQIMLSIIIVLRTPSIHNKKHFFKFLIRFTMYKMMLVPIFCLSFHHICTQIFHLINHFSFI